MKRIAYLLFAICSSVSCKSDDREACMPDASYDPPIDPADFGRGVDNPRWPLVRGTRAILEGAGERIEITVTAETKQILGVNTIVVRDRVTVASEVVEDTYDWFAPDNDGTVWYFGEDSTFYENGKLAGSEGSWEAGVDGAKPGVVMHAVQPRSGSAYRQEYHACEAEGFAEVVRLDETVSVPYGELAHCLQTVEYTPIEPDVREFKYYCPGVGLALEVDLSTGYRTELIDVIEE
jgi:hypothetical protein